MSNSDATGFFDAIKTADHNRVRQLLNDDPALIRAFDARSFGTTPLVHAAGMGDREMIDILLAAGADPNQRNDWWAGGFGVLDDCTAETAEYLLQRGTTLTPHAAARLGRIDDLRTILKRDANAVHQRGGDGQFPLHFAATPEIAELLLSHGAEIDALDIDHASTAAEWRATEKPDVAAFLVQRGARSDPFMAALIGDAAGLVRLLATEPECASLRITRTRFPAEPPAAGHIYLYTIGEGCTLLHAAANANQPTIVRLLAADPRTNINARAGYDDQTPLHAAAWRNTAAAAEALLDAGADINAVSGPLHRNEPLGWAIVSGASAVVRVLLARGATIRPHHRTDAARGESGQFRCFNHHRPLTDWADINALISAT